MIRICARAPGKLVVLGEYAVLDGAPALVIAVDRSCVATLEPAAGGSCTLRVRMAADTVYEHAPEARSGVALVDLVRTEVGSRGPSQAWRAMLDSSAFWHGGTKLGLGSSAAALCAWAGAWRAFAQPNAGLPPVAELIELHRRWQGGRGSGLDVAASCHGGVIEYRLAPGGEAQVGSVRLPNSVGFAGIFAGRSASTPELVGRYRGFCAERPRDAAAHHGRLRAIASAGCAAARGDDAAAFIAAVAEYGRALGDLGVAIGGEIVTAEHRRIGVEAERCGVAYKVSGAGGGDLGFAAAIDPDALDAFKRSMNEHHFHVVELRVAERGLTVEERAE